MKTYFISRGYREKHIQQAINIVREMDRNTLLCEKNESQKSNNSQKVLVCTWHPNLKHLPKILEQNHKILSTDPRLSKIFVKTSTVTFRKRKNLSNHLCKNDIKKREEEEKIIKICKGCQLCKIMSKKDTISNENTGVTIKIKKGGTCKSTGVIYAVNCKKCKSIYVGHSGDPMSNRYSKHKYDITKRPEQNELSSHCHKNHDLEKDLEVYIIDYGIPKLEQREHLEDKYICKLQTLHPQGLITRIGPYAKEMYKCWTSVITN